MLNVAPEQYGLSEIVAPPFDRARELDVLYREVLSNIDRAKRLDDDFLVYMLSMIAQTVVEHRSNLEAPARSRD